MTLPFLGGSRLVYWLSRTMAEQAERELLDEGPLRAALLELQQRYDAGELTEEQYDVQERPLLERMNAIREMKVGRNAAG